jgi:hypothetical protein
MPSLPTNPGETESQWYCGLRCGPSFHPGTHPATSRAPRLRNLAGLRSLAEMEEYMRRAQERIATGAALRGHGTHEWITMSPAAWFNALYLRKRCPLIEMLLKPDTRTIPKLASLQVPFCLQCRVCFGEGVYDAELIAYCLDCLPLILGYAAASRFIHCVLDLHRSLGGTHQALRVKPPLSSRGSRICDQILAMTPHVLPYLVIGWCNYVDHNDSKNRNR